MIRVCILFAEAYLGLMNRMTFRLKHMLNLSATCTLKTFATAATSFTDFVYACTHVLINTTNSLLHNRFGTQPDKNASGLSE